VREETSEPTTTIFDDIAIVTVRGELDFAHCIKLAPELNAALRSSARAIVIDLEAVSLGTPRESRCCSTPSAT
jgi:anti-anti-sigma regulatory factor